MDAKCDRCDGSGYLRFIQQTRYERVEGRVQEITGDAVEIPANVTEWEAYNQYPMSDGWRISMGYCACMQKRMRQRKIDKLIQQKDVPDNLTQFSLADFETVPHAQAALDCIRQMADGYVIDPETGEKKPGLLLEGPTGTFKSTLAGLYYVERVDQSLWLNWNTWLERLKDTYKKDYTGASIGDLTLMAGQTGFLLVDDLGSLTKKGLYFEDAIETIRAVCEYRLYKRMPTIVTTNLSVDQLYDQFGDRAVSRLRGLCARVQMVAPDARIVPVVRREEKVL